MELSRGDKQKQTEWTKSKTRETLSGLSTELLTLADQRMKSDQVHVRYNSRRARSRSIQKRQSAGILIFTLHR